MKSTAALLLSILLLPGCATSAAGLMQSNVDQVIESPRTPRSFATCVAETMMGNNPLRNEGDHWWVLRLNGYGIPIVRWDFYPREGGGSRAELRSSFGITVGDERVRTCVNAPPN